MIFQLARLTLAQSFGHSLASAHVQACGIEVYVRWNISHIQAGEIPKGTVKDLKKLNKSLRFPKQHANLTLQFMAKNEKKKKKKDATLNGLCLVWYADAAFCVRADKTSQGGFVIFACEMEF